MVDLDFVVLVLVISFTAIAIFISYLTCRNSVQRLLLIPCIIGFAFFNGLAASSEAMPSFMVAGYFVFVVTLVLGFRIGVIAFYPVGFTFSKHAEPVLKTLSSGRLARFIILLYIFLLFLSLMTPSFRLHLLFTPPSPDIRSLFDSRFEGDRNIVSNLIGIATILIMPLYYLSLYRYRRNIICLFVFLAAPLYLIYVRDAYLGRYTIAFALLFFYAVLWSSYSRLRLPMLISAVLMLPLLAVLAHGYSFSRLGVTASEYGGLDAVWALLSFEMYFPVLFGIPLVESGEQASLIGYFFWLITLPIPGFLKGSIPILFLNYEMSEIVLGVQRGTRQFNVILPGLLAEGIFLYGRVLYFIHPLSIGFTLGAFAAILQRLPRVETLIFFLAILFFFNLNRGGVASVAPVLINGFLLFFLIVLCSVIVGQRRRKYF